MFGLEVVARNVDPDNPTKALPINKSLAAFSHSVHHWLGEAMIVAVILHVIGALKHHLIDRDGTLRRMLGARV